MKIAANTRRGHYKRRPMIVARRKDAHVLKSSRGKFTSVAALEAHRIAAMVTVADRKRCSSLAA